MLRFFGGGGGGGRGGGGVNLVVIEKKLMLHRLASDGEYRYCRFVLLKTFALELNDD